MRLSLFPTVKFATQAEFYVSREILVLPSLLLANTNLIWLKENRVFKNVKLPQTSSVQQRQAEHQDPGRFLHFEALFSVNSDAIKSTRKRDFMEALPQEKLFSERVSC